MADPARCVDIIWAEEKSRFEEQEEAMDASSKNVVAILNIAAAPFILYYVFNIVPFNALLEMARFYTTNNCQAIGGLKCTDQDGQLSGPQGQKLPNIVKVLTPPKKINRTAVTPLSRAADEQAELESGELFPQ